MRAVQISPIGLLGLLLAVGCEHSLPSEMSPTLQSTQSVRNLRGGPPGSLVFHSARAGNLEIYLANPDGSDPQRLTNSPTEDAWPDISTNGRYVAFASLRTGNREVFVLDLREGRS